MSYGITSHKDGILGPDERQVGSDEAQTPRETISELMIRLEASQRACFDAGQHVAAMDIQSVRASLATILAAPPTAQPDPKGDLAKTFPAFAEGFQQGHEWCSEFTTSEREAVLKMLASLFSESVHETWTTEEIVNIIEDAIRLGSSGVGASPKVTLPLQLTGEIACILEDCAPPEKQSDAAVAALIMSYQPTWDAIVSALSRPHHSGD